MKRFLILLTLIITLIGPQVTTGAGISKDRVIDLVNQDRLESGLIAVVENSQLNLAAKSKAQEMLDHNVFDHFMPDDHSPWDFMLISGYDYAYAGENLAMGWLSAEAQHQAWMQSASHRKNIMNPIYRDIGIAVLEGELEGQKTTLVVQMFGEQRNQEGFVLDELTQLVGKLLGVE